MNRIIRNKDNGYSVINNHCLRNKNISEKAKGVFAIIMSLPDNWDFSINGLISICHGGETAIRSAIKELIEHGYCERNVSKDLDTKKILGWEYTFSEKPLCDFPQVDFPQVGFPKVENQVQLSKEELIPKETNKDLLKKSLMKSFDTSGCSEEFILSYNIAEAFRKKFIKIIEEKGGSMTELENAKVDAWVKPIILLQKTDKVSIEKIREVYKEFGNLDFWTGVTSSTSGVRKNFNKIVMAIGKLKPNQKSISNEMTPQDKNKLIRQQMGI
jgi:hypothetical protein